MTGLATVHSGCDEPPCSRGRGGDPPPAQMTRREGRPRPSALASALAPIMPNVGKAVSAEWGLPAKKIDLDASDALKTRRGDKEGRAWNGPADQPAVSGRRERACQGEGSGPTSASTAGATSVVYIVPEQTPPAVRLVLGQRPGWTEWNAEVHGPNEWNFQWRSGRFKPSEYGSVCGHQRLNHFPRSALITRKDLLLRVLRKMKAVHGAVYAFHPDSYMLPTEYTKFIGEFTRLQNHHHTARGCPSAAEDIPSWSPTSSEERAGSDRRGARRGEGQAKEGAERRRADAGDTGARWIVKPSDSSRGRGVYLLRELGELAYDQPSIVQRYIPDPLTVGGYKADLRLYAVVTSLHPMTVHLYRDGIVRYATSKYERSPHHDLFGHLTNSSINKRSPFASREKDVIGGGCKWRLQTLQRWVEETTKNGVERWSRLWAKIRSLVSLSVLPLADVVPGGTAHASCFELFGFDVMVDSRLSRPHLIEVNCSPALGLDELSDRQVKLPLISDLLDLVDVESACRSEENARIAKHSHEKSLPGYCRPLDSSIASASSSAPNRRQSRRLPEQVTEGAGATRILPSTTDRPNAGDFGEAKAGGGRGGSRKGENTAVGWTVGAAKLEREEATPRSPADVDKGTTPLAATPPTAHNASPTRMTVAATPARRGLGFELVFPFNAASGEHARCLSENARAGRSRRIKVQACVRAIIAEVKAQEKRSLQELQLSPRRCKAGPSAGEGDEKGPESATGKKNAGRRGAREERGGDAGPARRSAPSRLKGSAKHAPRGEEAAAAISVGKRRAGFANLGLETRMPATTSRTETPSWGEEAPRPPTTGIRGQWRQQRRPQSLTTPVMKSEGSAKASGAGAGLPPR